MKNKIFASWIYVVEIFATKTRRHDGKSMISACNTLSFPVVKYGSQSDYLNYLSEKSQKTLIINIIFCFQRDIYQIFRLIYGRLRFYTINISN